MDYNEAVEYISEQVNNGNVCAYDLINDLLGMLDDLDTTAVGALAENMRDYFEE